ncbi:MAG TPA: TldD/PmbA family protein, partial [Pyrodictium sp.]|nr:TldD/PmbA family protein [Pyrodictium sp.]
MHSLGQDMLSKAVDFMESEGAEYSEARYHRLELFEIAAQNGKLMGVGMNVREGFAARVFCGGSMGFAASPGVSRLALFSVAKRAVSQAKATPSKLSPGYRLSSDRLGYARVIVGVKKPFDHLSLEEKLDLVVKRIYDAITSSLREAKLASLSVHYTEILEEKEVVNSDGGWVYSLTPRVGVNVLITIHHPSKGTLQRWLELGGVGGLELLKEWNVEDMLANEVSRL